MSEDKKEAARAQGGLSLLELSDAHHKAAFMERVFVAAVQAGKDVDETYVAMLTGRIESMWTQIRRVRSGGG